MSAKIVLYGPSESQLQAYQEVAPEDVEVAWVDSGQSVDDATAQMQDTVAVLFGGGPISPDVAAKIPNLRLIQTTSAGTNHLDKMALGELGVKVANNGGGNAISVAEHTIALLVSTLRKLQLQFSTVQDRKWAGDIRQKWFSQAQEIAGKRIGIRGLGRIGSRVARRLAGWECEIVYTDIIDIPKELEEELNVTRLSLDELLQTSDIVTLHVPLTTQAHGMMSDREFDLMKPTAILINACRGPVVDEAALIRAMQQEKIAAAGLDVTEVEPTPEDNPLLDMDNVLITPHFASFTQESGVRSRTFAVANAARVARGEEPESVVLPD